MAGSYGSTCLMFSKCQTVFHVILPFYSLSFFGCGSSLVAGHGLLSCSSLAP